MSHITIIIDAVTPTPPAGAAATTDADQFKVSVSYTPADTHTPSQIGNEIARITRRVNQIIEGTPD